MWLALPLSEERAILELVDEFRNDLINVRFMPDVRALGALRWKRDRVARLSNHQPAASPLPPNALVKKGTVRSHLRTARVDWPCRRFLLACAR